MHGDLTREERWLLEEKYACDTNARGFAADRRRLAEGEPVAYLIGWQPFLGLKIHLDSKPLIPRPETEWWVEQLLTRPAEQDSAGFGGVPQRDGARRSKFSAENYATPEAGTVLRVLDLCAGSGAIGCAVLKHLQNAEVWFAELDPAHEPTIRKNVRENDLDETRAHIIIGDLFAPLPTDLYFDIIAANPPYIPEGRALPASVGHHEPALALYAGADGLALTRRIAEALPARLTPGAEAWVECDSAHAEAARDLFEAAGLRAELMHDHYGAPRVVVVSWP